MPDPHMTPPYSVGIAGNENKIINCHIIPWHSDDWQLLVRYMGENEYCVLQLVEQLESSGNYKVIDGPYMNAEDATKAAQSML